MTHVLIAGKETGGAIFAKTAAECGRTAVLTVGQDVSDADIGDFDTPVCAVAWNKASPISARAAILGFESKFSKIDEALLVFDTAVQGADFSTKNCSRMLDSIAGYMYMTAELLMRFAKKGGGDIVFLFQESGDEIFEEKTGILPHTGAAAFRAFAENISRVYAQESFMRVFLLETPKEQQDTQIARWVFSHLDETAAAKQKWVRYGAKRTFDFLFNSKSYTK
ncbi:MAG: hypothetical protein Pg6C_16530 [Treponemataceae bacterium]|nr:MAG: hypothetical protein Pg6C_16530 [Treponemataceae bacterium]